MKKLFVGLIALLALSVLAISVFALKKNPEYYATYGTAEIDGRASAGEWNNAAVIELANVSTENNSMIANPTVKLMHDGTYLYALLEAPTPNIANDDIFVSVHVPHEGCTENGCKSYLRFVIDGEALAKEGKGYKPWTYYRDADFDGKNDLDGDGAKTDACTVVYGEKRNKLVAELRIAANYGEAIPTDSPLLLDIRFDEGNIIATHQWANSPRTWDASFDPARDGGRLTLVAEGAEPPEIKVEKTGPAPQGLTYKAPTGTVTVDGALDDAWENAPWETVERGNTASIAGRFKVMHDDSYMYFIGQYTDTTIGTKFNESIKLHIHRDACDRGKDCPTYETYILTVTPSAWAVKAATAVRFGRGLDLQLSSNVSGNDMTIECALKLPDAIAFGGMFFEVEIEDYAADGTWIAPRRWTTEHSGSSVALGTLYFVDDTYIEAEPVETEPAETEPHETEEKESKPAESAKPNATGPAETDAAGKNETPSEFPVIPVIIVAAAVFAVAVGIAFAKKKTK